MAIDPQQIKTQGTYQAHAPLAVIQQDLVEIGRIAAVDQAHSRTKKRNGALALVGGIIVLIAGFVIHSGVVDLLGLAGIGVGIFFLVTSKGKGDLVEYPARLEKLKALLDTLGHDSRPSTPVTVRFTTREQPQVMKQQPMATRQNGKEELVKSHWLSIQTEMLDGTEVSEEIVELRRKRSFTNARGKSKTKVRSQYLLTLRFKYPSEVYGDLRSGQEILQKEIRLPATATLRGVRISEKAILAKVLLSAENDLVQTTVMLCMGIYKLMNLSRRVAAGLATGGPGGAR